MYNIDVLTVNIEFMWRDLETVEWRALSESFHSFCAEPHTLYIYLQYTNIVFILLENLPTKNVIQFNNRKQITETPLVPH